MTSFDVVLDLSVEDAESAVRAALVEHGFGVLTEIGHVPRSGVTDGST